MSETLDPVAMELDQRQLAAQLLAQAKEQGVELVGPNGLLNQLTKNVLETALDAEMTEHLGYDKHDPAGRGSGNSRNGTRAKTVLTEIGPVATDVTTGGVSPGLAGIEEERGLLQKGALFLLPPPLVPLGTPSSAPKRSREA